MQKQLTTCGFALLFVIISSCTHTPSENACKERRGVIDVGSSSTKMVVADVDKCNNRLIALVPIQDVESAKPVVDRKIDYTSDVLEGKKNRFSKKIQDEGVAAVKTLKSLGDKAGVQVWAGVATAIFREATNTDELMQRFREETGIDIKVIPQKTEAEIGYRSAKSLIEDSRKKVIVWDTGSRSTQFSYEAEDGTIAYFDVDIASTSFKKYIIVELQKKPYSSKSSPNPISAAQKVKAVDFARRTAQRPNLAPLRTMLKSKDVEVVAIGGVLTKSVAKQVGSTTVTVDMVKQELDRKVKAKMDDKALQNPFADTQVSNLALVAGFMEGAGISRYRAADVSLPEGVLLMPGFFPSSVAK